MSIEFYIGDMLRSIGGLVADVMDAAYQGAKAVGRLSVSVVVGAGKSVANLVNKIKDEYNRAKEERELYHQDLERLFSDIDLSVAKADKWIEKNSRSTYVYDDYLFEIEKCCIEEARESQYLSEELRLEVEELYSEFQNSYELNVKQREKLCERAYKFRTKLDDELRRNLAVIKTLIGEDFKEEEMVDVQKSIIEATKHPDFYESIKKLLKYVQEADEKDSKCMHRHHSASDVIAYILNEQPAEVSYEQVDDMYAENVEVGTVNQQIDKKNQNNKFKRG